MIFRYMWVLKILLVYTGIKYLSGTYMWVSNIVLVYTCGYQILLRYMWVSNIVLVYIGIECCSRTCGYHIPFWYMVNVHMWVLNTVLVHVGVNYRSMLQTRLQDHLFALVKGKE